jgi:hypothetical protein
VDETLVVGGGDKRGGSGRILTSVLCVVIEYLCTILAVVLPAGNSIYYLSPIYYAKELV